MLARKPLPNGKRNSASSKPVSHKRVGRPKSEGQPAVEDRNGILYPSPALEKALRGVFDEWRDDDKLLDRDAYRRDFVFHMTDWLNDLAALQDFYHHPERYGKDRASQLVFGFLIHAIPHLNAAGRILLDGLVDSFAKLYHPKDQQVREGD